MCSKALGINRNSNHRNTVSDDPSYSFNEYWCSIAETVIKTQCLSRGACHLVEGQITHRCIYHIFSKRKTKAKDIEGEPRVQFQMQNAGASPVRAEHPDGGQGRCKGASRKSVGKPCAGRAGQEQQGGGTVGEVPRAQPRRTCTRDELYTEF